MKEIREKEKVIKMIKPNPVAACRLFCFPYAGGSASVFKDWANSLYPYVEVCAVQMPGRENRIVEEPYLEIDEFVDEVLSVWDRYDNKPYAFFGHSLGGIICFETARKLCKRIGSKPNIIFVSGCEEPKMRRKDEIHRLPKDEFIMKIKEMGGTPDLILQNKELLELFLPMLRADFTMIETYMYKEEEPVDCNLVVYGGSEDKDVDFNSLVNWVNYTTSDFSIQKIKGGHFFLKESSEELLKSVLYHLQNQFSMV